MKNILNILNSFVKTIYKRIKNAYIYCFYGTVSFFENVIRLVFGEEYLENLWAQWYHIVFFYKSLWHILKKRLYDYYEDIKLMIIWKIKRSSHWLMKWLNKFLSKYDWFNNNIIKF